MDSGDQPAVESTLEEAGVAFAYLFGSRATGTEHARSDADIAISGARDLGLLEGERLADRLARALGVPSVDLVVLERAGLELRGEVVQRGHLLFSHDEPARVAFEVRTRSEYLDYLPTLRAHTRRYLEQTAKRGA